MKQTQTNIKMSMEEHEYMLESQNVSQNNMNSMLEK